MAHWRLRDFVPDSDEEGEELSQTSLELHRTASHEDADRRSPLLTLSSTSLNSRSRQKDGRDTLRGITPNQDQDGPIPRAVGSMQNLEGSEDEIDELALPALKPVNIGLESRRDAGRKDHRKAFENSDDPSLNDGKSRSKEASVQVVEQEMEDRTLEDVADLSSDLSSAPTTPDFIPDREPCRGYGSEPRVPRQTGPMVLIQSRTAQREATHGLSRSFRHRTAIQLNPYAIEGQRYRDSLQSRGLKPISIQEQIDRETQDIQDDPNIQSSSSDEDTQNLSTSLPGPASSSPFHQAEERLLHNDPSHLAHDDEFPDVDKVLRELPQGVAKEGFKRRKTAHTYSRKPRSRDGNFDESSFIPLHGKRRFKVPRGIEHHGRKPSNRIQLSPDAISAEERLNKPNLPSPTLESILPSPALTDSPEVDQSFEIGADIDISPPRLTPRKQMRTPAASSEHKQTSKIPPVEISDEPKDGEGDDANTTVSDSSGGSSEESDVDRELLLAQRRTKGVLPASWHRLNRQRQTDKMVKAQKRRRSTLQSPSQGHRKGVAIRRPLSYPVAQPYGATAGAPVFIDSGSESDSAPEVAETRKRVDITQRLDDVWGFERSPVVNVSSDEDDENMEDDSIDAMAPSISRKLTVSRKNNRSQQPKITDVLRPTKGPKRTEVPFKGRNMTTGTMHPKEIQRLQPPIRRATRPHVPMSILDVENNNDRGTPPNFLLVARRTARKRKDQASHSPSNKIFRLHTRPETSVVQRSLEEWKSGRMKRRQQRRPKQQQPPSVERGDYQLNDSELGHDHGWELDNVEQSTADDRLLLTRTSTIDCQPQGIDERILFSPAQPSNKVGRPKNVQTTRKATSFLKPLQVLRPAQLESLRQQRAKASTETSVHAYVLDRFLQLATAKQSTTLPRTGHISEAGEEVSPTLRRPVQRRKRSPKQISLDDPQSPEAGLGSYAEYPVIETTNQTMKVPLSPRRDTSFVSFGFQEYAREYSITFDILHLPDGPLFDDTSLVGSGDFARSLTNRDYHKSSSALDVHRGSDVWEWQDWDETVSDQMHRSINMVIEQLRLNKAPTPVDSDQRVVCLYLLDSLIRYFSTHLKFVDPIDRTIFAKRVLSWLELAVAALPVPWGRSNLTVKERTFVISSTTKLTVLTNQFRNIVNHALVSQEMRSDATALFSAALHFGARMLLKQGFLDFELLSHDYVAMFGYPSRRDARVSAEALVVMRHLLPMAGPYTNIWDVIDKEQGFPALNDERDVSELDGQWKGLFSLLPWFEVSAHGFAVKEDFKSQMAANWRFVKQLMKLVLSTGSSELAHRGPKFGSYCRATFQRCLHLIQYWRWFECETIITSVFDYFTRNNLADLPSEDSNGSPQFLEDLTEQTQIVFDKKDRAFHILLKIIGAGLRHMRVSASPSSTKRIANCVFRLTPNHDRCLPKDEKLRQEDLDAVRNHLDLLCTLYWASPREHRLRLDIIQRVIDLENSHQKACLLVVRSWACLVQYQLSTPEPTSSIDPFIGWLDEILEKTTKLHYLARTEVEQDTKATEAAEGRIVPLDIREAIIYNSQRHVEAIITDTLCALGRALDRAKTKHSLRRLFSPKLTKVLALFDSRRPRINEAVIKALDIFQLYFARMESLSEDGDSQGFGNFPDLEEVFPETDVGSSAILDDSIYKALHTLLSDAMGADWAADDSVLAAIVETWLMAAQAIVKAGNKTWDAFAGPYGEDSWKTLRGTDQMRRFTPFFFATLLRLDPTTYDSHKTMIFSEWASCIVERNALVKYEPLFTSELLNLGAEETLLENPTFSKKFNGEFEISITNFCRHRLELISSLLSNMRESVSFLTYHKLEERIPRTQLYAEMLRQLMTVMKTNYKGLGQQSEMQGTYATFVHKVVELLKQHTSNICKVDTFFTDALNFPLPENDPEYIGARLKSLGYQLKEPGAPQHLLSFIQTLCERAAYGVEYDRFASVFAASMEGAITKPSFLSIMLGVALPLYTDAALRFPCGWMIAMPVLLSSTATVKSFFFGINSFDTARMKAIGRLLKNTVYGIHDSWSILSSEPTLCLRPSTFRVLTVNIELLIEVLEPLAYFRQVIQPATERKDSIAAVLEELRDFVLFFLGIDPPKDVSLFFHTPAPQRGLSSAFKEARTFASNQLRSALDAESTACKWKLDDHGKYWYLKSRWWEMVPAYIGSRHQEQARFVEKAKAFVLGVDTLHDLLGVRKSGARIAVNAGDDDHEGQPDRRPPLAEHMFF